MLPSFEYSIFNENSHMLITKGIYFLNITSTNLPNSQTVLSQNRLRFNTLKTSIIPQLLLNFSTSEILLYCMIKQSQKHRSICIKQNGTKDSQMSFKRFKKLFFGNCVYFFSVFFQLTLSSQLWNCLGGFLMVKHDTSLDCLPDVYMFEKNSPKRVILFP